MGLEAGVRHADKAATSEVGPQGPCLPRRASSGTASVLVLAMTIRSSPTLRRRVANTASSALPVLPDESNAPSELHERSGCWEVHVRMTLRFGTLELARSILRGRQHLRRQDRIGDQGEARTPQHPTELHRQAHRPHSLRKPPTPRPRYREWRRRGSHQVRALEALRPRRDALDQRPRPGCRTAPVHGRERRLGSFRALRRRASARCPLAHPATSCRGATSCRVRTDAGGSAPTRFL